MLCTSEKWFFVSIMTSTIVHLHGRNIKNRFYAQMKSIKSDFELRILHKYSFNHLKRADEKKIE